MFYRRYVDDIFCIFNNEDDALSFFNYLNLQHKNIDFTIEEEHDNKLPFLDILITKNTATNTYTTSTFHKKTYTGLLFNFFSFTSQKYKIGLIKTLIDSIRKLTPRRLATIMIQTLSLTISNKTPFPGLS